MKILKVIPVLFLALALLACSFSVNVPSVDTGVTKTFEINESALPNVESNKVAIKMGAGTVNISSGATQLIEGSIRYNVDIWEPVITRSDEEITLSQDTSGDVGFPDGNITNDWVLKFGDMPIDLTLSTGAYEGNLDLSGLSITNLKVSDGASKATIRFDSLNPVVMEELNYNTGASNVELIGLGNANVKNVYFDSGVGSYKLDFTGDVQDDIDVRINTGMSDMTIVVPSNVQVKVIVDGGLSNVDANGTWTITGTTYECGSSGPMITINLDMSVGNLNLRQE